jgi:hypothetical protein
MTTHDTPAPEPDGELLRAACEGAVEGVDRVLGKMARGMMSYIDISRALAEVSTVLHRAAAASRARRERGKP